MLKEPKSEVLKALAMLAPFAILALLVGFAVGALAAAAPWLEAKISAAIETLDPEALYSSTVHSDTHPSVHYSGDAGYDSIPCNAPPERL